MDGHACTLSAIYSICRVFLPGALQCVPFNSRSVSRVRLQRDFGTVLWARSLQRAKAGQGCAARTCARDRGGLGECHLSAPRARAPAAICWRCPGCGRGCLGCGRGDPGAPVPARTCTGPWRPVCGTEVAPSLPWITQEARIQQMVKFFGTRRELS